MALRAFLLHRLPDVGELPGRRRPDEGAVEPRNRYLEDGADVSGDGGGRFGGGVETAAEGEGLAVQEPGFGMSFEVNGRSVAPAHHMQPAHSFPGHRDEFALVARRAGGFGELFHLPQPEDVLFPVTHPVDGVPERFVGGDGHLAGEVCIGADAVVMVFSPPFGVPGTPDEPAEDLFLDGTGLGGITLPGAGASGKDEAGESDEEIHMLRGLGQARGCSSPARKTLRRKGVWWR